MASIINASVASSGIVSTADASGILKVQSNGVTTNALAWVNFNGVTTTTIRSSYNVSSVTYVSTGTYTINYTNALADANYCVTGTGTGPSYGANSRVLNVNTAPTTTSVQVVVTTSSTTNAVDSISTNVAIFGT
jgi:hypothetical protein